MQTKISRALSFATIAGMLSWSIAMAGVSPDLVEKTMKIGTSAMVDKVVTTPPIPPKPDIVFLADTTGSMGPAIGNVQTNASSIMSDVLAAQPDAQFGAAQYKDEGDALLFNIDQAVTANTTDVSTAVGTWTAIGGGDTAEGWINALFQIGTNPGVGFRTGSTRIVVIFGDATSHDPSNGHSMADAIAALNAASVHVIAVPVVSGFGDGLDGTGQATAVTGATGGVLVPSADPDDVAAAILAGLGNLPVTVSWTVDGCAPNLDVSLAPASVTVTSGDPANFTETIEVANDPSLMGTTQMCIVHFMDENGNSLGDEKIVIHILDTVAPEASCIPTTNPAGKNVPSASKTNEDGYYQLLGSDNVAVASIVVRDGGSSFVSGLFANGDKVKITQAPGATPSDNRPGPGVIVSHLKLNGDAILKVTDTSGNVTEVSCLVPPKPK